MKKVLVFGITENPGGIESVIMNYYRSFDKSKIQLDFLCNTEVVAYEDEIKKLGGKIFRITARSKNYFLYKKQLDNFFKKNAKKYSSIWVNVCSLANIDYLKYAKKYGIKKRIIHCHNSQNMDSVFRGLLHKYNKLFIKKYATDFWSCANSASNWFYNNKIIKSSKYLLVNNAIDYKKYMYNKKARDIIRKKLNLNDKIVFGNVGRLHFQKNQEFAIKVFYEFSKNHPNSIFYIIGDGEDRKKLLNLINDLNISDKVFLLGLRDDVNELLQAMDIFLFPSFFEGLSLSLIEAQASKLLIFTSTGVSKETKMSDCIHFLDIEKGPVFWSNIIQKNIKNINRSSITDEIKARGFDILEQSNILIERL